MMLIDTGVLPDRLDHLDRIDPWPTHSWKLQRLLKSGSFALTRNGICCTARRRAQRRGDSAGSAYSLREIIWVTLDFLDWINNRDVALAYVSQHDIDAWLVETPGARPYFVRDRLVAGSVRGAGRALARSGRRTSLPLALSRNT